MSGHSKFANIKHHKFIRIGFVFFFVHDDLAFRIKHIRYTACRSYVSVSFGKCVTYIGSSTVFVVGKRFYDDCSGCRRRGF